MNEQLDKLLLTGVELATAAESETSSDVFAVGGLLHDLGLIDMPTRPLPMPCHVFGRWLELARRASGLTLLDISERTATDLHELLQIECGEAAAVQPRTVHQLAVLFAVDPRRLAVIAGLVQERPDASLALAAVRFAAQSESVAKLTATEQEALTEFVRILGSSEK